MSDFRGSLEGTTTNKASIPEQGFDNASVASRLALDVYGFSGADLIKIEQQPQLSLVQQLWKDQEAQPEEPGNSGILGERPDYSEWAKQYSKDHPDEYDKIFDEWLSNVIQNLVKVNSWGNYVYTKPSSFDDWLHDHVEREKRAQQWLESPEGQKSQREQEQHERASEEYLELHPWMLI